MATNNPDQTSSDLPTTLGKPAHRALTTAGYVRLEQFTQISAAAVLRLHGVGPNAIAQIRRALAEKGLSFANEA